MNEYKYLMIFEDGTVSKSESLSNGDECAADDGLIQIIRLGDLKSYHNGEWADIKIWTE